ncbi:MAG: transpeptidase family protein [Bacteroidales bacterium]|nr:transpeptidase family protein [Bacteroidales bacterium]MCB9012994.1 transpeptidase family protein [Bacteroidales bacterium]
MSVKKDILWRVAMVYLFMVVFALSIFGRIIYLQFAEKDKWSVDSEAAPLRQVPIASTRGDIYSADGRVLALSVPYYEIRMDFTVDYLTNDIFFSQVDALSRELASLFGDKSWDRYKRELVEARKAKKQYYLVKDDVSYDQMRKAREFHIFRLGRFKGGVRFIKTSKRIRPNGYLAARTIGSTTRSELGNRVGIEGSFDELLTGTEGLLLQKRLGKDLYVPLGDGYEIDPKDGKDIITTIDLNIQDVAEKALLRQLTAHNARHGTAVLMEVKTGEIKAIANLQRDENGRYYESYNFAVGESTVPGSTFKLVSLMLAMEDGYVDIDDIVNTGNGEISYYGKKLVDSGDESFGAITVQQVFEKSSNVGVSKIIFENYKDHPEKFINGIYKLGLNKPLGLDIRGEGRPEIKSPDNKTWSGITLPWMSIGYEMAVTPLQILSLYNAVANNGVMVKPRLVKEVRYHGSLVESYGPEIINSSICSRSTLRKLQKMCLGVVERGTASNLKNDNFLIAGKTGTAQIPDSKTGYSQKSRITYQASFVGYFPADNPRYSCIVVVNAPSKYVYYGNVVAGPVFREIANKVYATSLDMHEAINDKKVQLADIPYTKNGNYKALKTVLDELDIPMKKPLTKSDWVSATVEGDQLAVSSRSVIEKLVPNVVGMGLKDALYLMEDAGLRVNVSGRGTVRFQSVPPGTLAGSVGGVNLEMTIPDN